ncbi:hypothetical protein QBC35DRAFT_500279 [Podospora australis]|uniref:Uncharacterized protein n=1 Tax=Podospora australis TaxID=1536484 RepID=A0AAN6WRJ7_9PEZI|nr:hypothetical protein QBC35DRAFT_500279 [Podospora australis]
MCLGGLFVKRATIFLFPHLQFFLDHDDQFTTKEMSISLRLLVPPFLLSLSGFVTPASALSLNDWLNNNPYKDNVGTVQEQIQCYALPYGAIGFSSHILTYFTAFMLSKGRNPIFPWQRLKYKKFNLAVALVGFIITLILTVLTMVRCKNHWAFILIAVWKLVLSVTLTGMTVQAALEILETPGGKLTAPSSSGSVYGTPSPWSEDGHGYDEYPMLEVSKPQALSSHGRRRYSFDSAHSRQPLKLPSVQELRQYRQQRQEELDEEEYYLWSGLSNKKGRYHRVWYWFPLYFLGAVIGFVGVMNVVSKHIAANKQVQIITGAFGGVTALIVLAIMITCWLLMSGSGVLGSVGVPCLAGTGVAVFVLSVLFAFYTDWVLAALAGDLVGVPSSDNAVFYWMYFAAKRLPMVSV